MNLHQNLKVVNLYIHKNMTMPQIAHELNIDKNRVADHLKYAEFISPVIGKQIREKRISNTLKRAR